jgi:hypothetical protein
MKEQSFDEFFREALLRDALPPDSGSWGVFLSRMEEAGSGMEFDRLMGDKLRHLELGADTENWKGFVSKMVVRRRLRRRVWVLKLGEMAIFLLFCGYMLGYLNQAGNKSIPNLRYAPADAAPVADRGAVLGGTTLNFRGRVHTDEHTPDPTAGPVVYSGAALGGTTLDFGGRVNTDKQPADPTATAVAVVDKVGKSDAFDLRLSEPAQVPEALGGLMTEEISRRNLRLARLPSGEGVQPELITLSSRQWGGWYLGWSFGIGGFFYRDEAVSDRAVGFIGGGMVGYRRGRWGLESGLGVSKQAFVPKREIYLVSGSISTGFVGSHVARVDAWLLSVPVIATWKVLDSRRLDLGVRAGAAAHVAVLKNYQTVFETYPAISQIPNPGALGIMAGTPKAGAGWFEGGGLSGNFYTTLDVGFRLELALGNRRFIHLTPTAQWMPWRGSIGPVSGRIQGCQVEVGISLPLR